MTTLIVCPLRSELEFLIEELKSLSWSIVAKERNVGRVYLCENLSVLFLVGGLGEERIAEKTARITAQLPDLKRIICAGTAGQLNAELNIGDVIIDGSTIFKTVSNEFKVHYGSVVKRSQHSLSPEAAAEKSLGVAMEGESLRQLCHSLGREYLEIRGVTDFADSNVEKDFFSNQALAMKHVAQTIDAFFAVQLRD